LRWRRVPSTSGSGIRSQRFRYCEAALIDLILCRTKPHFAFGINEAGIGPLIVPSTGPARTANASHEPCNRYWPTPALALPAAGRGQCRDDERTAAFFNEKKKQNWRSAALPCQSNSATRLNRPGVVLLDCAAQPRPLYRGQTEMGWPQTCCPRWNTHFTRKTMGLCKVAPCPLWPAPGDSGERRPPPV
jgi:hypothetical protein